MRNRLQKGLLQRPRTTGKLQILVDVENDKGFTHDEPRPRTRGECEAGPRPCPWVSCRHHLALEVNPDTGVIKFNFPHVDVDDMPSTCSLDLADEGMRTLEVVGDLLNLTRERVRQVEVRAMLKIKASGLDRGDRDG